MIDKGIIDNLREHYNRRDCTEIRDIRALNEARSHVEVALFNLKRLRTGDYVTYWFEDSGPAQGHGDVSEVSAEHFRLSGHDKPIRYEQLKGLDLFPEVEDWTYEERLDLKLVERAELDVTSERIAIIDPGYTREHCIIFNQDFMRRLKEPAFMRLLYQNSPSDIALIQGKNAVYLSNFGGDGNYPIVKTNSGLEILFDYSLDGKEDPNKIGSVWVDYKMIMLADAGKVKQIDNPSEPSTARVIDEDSYQISPGRYNVSFLNTGQPRERYVPGKERGRVVELSKI